MTELKKTLGLPALLFYGIGMILGAGIYSVIGPAVGKAHDAIWMSFLGAAFIALLTGLSYAELATRIPKAGAEFSYTEKAFPKQKLLIFGTGLIVCFLGAATAATVALSFASYLQGFWEVPRGLTALLLLAVMTGINIIGMNLSSRLNILFTLIEISGLAIVIWLGSEKGLFSGDLGMSVNAGVLPATALLFFSYLGFENMAALAEEAKDPGRQLPRAIIGSVVITTVVYLLVGFAVTALIPPEQLINEEAPLAKVVAAGSQRMVPVLQGIALFATANTALISILSASRVAFSMARRGYLSKTFTKVASEKGSPWMATLLVGGAAALLLPLGKVEVVAELASLISLLVFAMVHVTLLRLRRQGEPQGDSFRVPLTIGKTPILPWVGLLAIAFMLLQFNGKVYGISAALLALIAGLYGFLKFKSGWTVGSEGTDRSLDRSRS